MSAPEEAPPPPPQREREARLRAGPHTHVILVRHGEPDWATDNGPSATDPGLTEFGQRQAEETARVLAQRQIDAVYVSPYQRSQETAAPLAAATGLKPKTIDGLREIGVQVDGLTQNEVDRYFRDGLRRRLGQHWHGWPGAESFRAFHERVTTAMTDILGKHGVIPKVEDDFTVWRVPRDERVTIAVVAHGGTNAVALTHLLDVRPVPWEWMRFESELAAFSVVQTRPIGTGDHVWSLLGFNETSHLAAAELR